MAEPRWSRPVVLLGGGLLAVCLGLGGTPVTTPPGPCGTGFSPGWSDDMATGTACEEAMGARHRAVLATGFPGAVLLGVGAAGRRGRRTARPEPLA